MITNYMKQKQIKSKIIYELHDDLGCIRKFKNKDMALYWKKNREELKLVIIKPKLEIIDFNKLEDALF